MDLRFVFPFTHLPHPHSSVNCPPPLPPHLPHSPHLAHAWLLAALDCSWLLTCSPPPSTIPPLLKVFLPLPSPPLRAARPFKPHPPHPLHCAQLQFISRRSSAVGLTTQSFPMADKPDPELDELLESAAKDFKKTQEPSTSAVAFDPSQFLNPDGSMNQEKWQKWQQEQEKIADELYEKAEQDFENSDQAKELTKALQASLAAAAKEQGLTPEEVTKRLNSLKLLAGKVAESAPAIDPSQFLNPDGSMNQEKWKKWQEEQEKIADAMYQKAELDFENSDQAKELTKALQASFGGGIAAGNAPAIDPSQFLNADGSLDQEKWMKWQEEQEKIAEALYQKAEQDFEGSDLAKELTKSLQEGLASAAQEQGLSPEEVSNRLKNLKLFGSNAPIGDPGKEKEFQDAIMGAMQSLRENLGEAFPAARDGEDGDGEEGVGNELENLSNVMQQMMLTLLSKDVLLPSFKELSEKYPGWLEENKSKLSEADLKRYTDQLEVVKEIVAELEKEETDDDKQHLERMVELMGKAQDLGQPPPDLTAQLGNPLDDAKIDAMLKNSGADQCNIM